MHLGISFMHVTWDGNLMIKNGKLTGLIDYAAVLWSDPLLSHDFHDFGDTPDPYFLQGYGKTEFLAAFGNGGGAGIPRIRRSTYV